MTLHQYNQLHRDDQLNFLWKEGFVIGERKNTRYSFILYKLNAFFVELRYYHSLLHGYQVYKDKKELESYKAIPLLKNL